MKSLDFPDGFCRWLKLGSKLYMSSVNKWIQRFDSNFDRISLKHSCSKKNCSTKQRGNSSLLCPSLKPWSMEIKHKTKNQRLNTSMHIAALPYAKSWSGSIKVLHYQQCEKLNLVRAMGLPAKNEWLHTVNEYFTTCAAMPNIYTVCAHTCWESTALHIDVH